MKDLLHKLSELPHRAIGSAYEVQTFDIIEKYLKNDNVSLEKQGFKSPYHFIQILWWALSGMIIGLFLAPYYPIIGFLLNALMVISLYVFFDWHPVWLSKLPPLITTYNFIGRNGDNSKLDENTPKKKKLVLMAHWDTVPISIMYHPKLLPSFEKSLWFNLVVMFLTTICCLTYVFDVLPTSLATWQSGLRIGFIAYLLFQCFWIGMDYWRFGYSNGANDNGTGVVTAVEVARYFWQNPIKDWDVELMLAGAEEVGLIGSQHYVKHADLTDTVVINFDNVGFDNVFVINQTKTFSTIDYTHFDLYKTARTVAETTPQYKSIIERPFRTTNVDSAPFAQKGAPSLTITSVDKNGLPTFIHRPEDTLSNVNPDSVQLTIDYTIDIVKKYTQHV